MLGSEFECRECGTPKLRPDDEDDDDDDDDDGGGGGGALLCARHPRGEHPLLGSRPLPHDVTTAACPGRRGCAPRRAGGVKLGAGGTAAPPVQFMIPVQILPTLGLSWSFVKL